MQNALHSDGLFLGAYEAIRLLGAGGMGQAYLGRNIHTGTDVVIKVMHPHLVHDSLSRRRFEAEIDLLRRFRHPHAVALLDADADHEMHPSLVQEFVPGVTLETLLRSEERLSIRRTARLAGQICQVLHALHGLGFLHRDLSAANVMVVQAGTPDEHVKIMDFGLASLTASGGVYLALDRLVGGQNSIGGGTPDYLCPEQIRKEPVDRRGDLYSFGVLLFQMLTGRLPFGEKETVPDILAAHLYAAPPSFSSLGADDVPPKLETLVRRLMAKQPSERPNDARQTVELCNHAVGFEIAPASAFQAGLAELDTFEGPCADDLEILDRFDAWMPEQIAVMKLRGFLDQVGGEALSSMPGKIRVRIRDPRVKTEPRPGGLLGFLGLRRPVLSEPNYLNLELLMENRCRDGRNLVELAVVLEPGKATDEEAMRRGFGERICRELRAYLMV